jgi:hypothetical protein
MANDHKDEHKESAPQEQKHGGGGGGEHKAEPQAHQQKDQERQQKEQERQQKEQERQQKEEQRQQQQQLRQQKEPKQNERQNGFERGEQGRQNEVRGSGNNGHNNAASGEGFNQRNNEVQVFRNNAEPGGGFNQRSNGESGGGFNQRNNGAQGGGGNPRNFGPRPVSPPPLQGFQRVPLPQAGQTMPHFAKNLNPQQRAQAQAAQQNMQNNLYAVPQGQQPANVQAIQSAQNSSYLNGYQTNLGGQPVVINPGNTYVNQMPQASWPSWYQPPAPGWGFATGLMLGSIAADLGWFRHSWPSYYGPQPSGFMYPPNYMPTPWMYQPWSNQWVQPGQMNFFNEGPPPDYTMPITVQAIEPMPINVMGPGGFPEREMVNQMVMYNAYYYPEFGRWGYVNRHGYFIWVNPQGMMAPL